MVARWLLLGCLCAVPIERSCSALEIQFRFAEGFDRYPAARAAVLKAGDVWESLLKDPVTVTLDVRFVPGLGDSNAWTDILGAEVTYSDLRELLRADATSRDDRSAVEHLQSGPALSFRISDPQGNLVVNTGEDVINKRISLSLPNARALGLEEYSQTDVDAKIHFNQSKAQAGIFDFDPSDGTLGVSFVAVTLHEIGHALGFVSGVDYIDSSTLPAGSLAPRDVRSEAVLTRLDLFRYSAESLPLIDVSPGGVAYFSVEGGQTELAHFSTGWFNGNGWQAMHWSGSQGIMGPATPMTSELSSVTNELSSVDLRALDAIGWNLAVPEPATWIMFAIGCVVAELTRRRQLVAHRGFPAARASATHHIFICQGECRSLKP